MSFREYTLTTPLALPPLIAHRGGSILAPENTLSAFQAASKAHCKWVELDVLYAKDGTPVVIHDETIDRTTNGTGPVSHYNMDSLQAFDAGSHYAASYQHEIIPSLSETLACLQSLGMCACVELKSPSHHHMQTIDLIHATCDLLQTYITAGAHYFFLSFDITYLQLAHQRFPRIPLGLNLYAKDPHTIRTEIKAMTKLIHSLPISLLNVNTEIISPDLITHLKTFCPNLASYTVNDPKQAHTLFAQGIDHIFSDNPLLLD